MALPIVEIRGVRRAAEAISRGAIGARGAVEVAWLTDIGLVGIRARVTAHDAGAILLVRLCSWARDAIRGQPANTSAAAAVTRLAACCGVTIVATGALGGAASIKEEP